MGFRSPVIFRGGTFRPREKFLIFLVFLTFALVCFGTFFFLPDRRIDNKVYRVYKRIQDAGQEFIIPPPPLRDEANIHVNDFRHHGAVVIDRPDPHLLEDRERLLAQIENEQKILRQRQEQEKVLPKPHLLSSSSESNKLDPEVDKKSDNGVVRDAVDELKDDVGNTASRARSGNVPLTSGGEDPDVAVREKRDVVKNMMKHAWNGYSSYAWGSNEVRPISKRGHSSSIFGSTAMGATIVDGLDTLYIMGMMDEYQKAKEWIEVNLDLGRMAGDVSVFETNIRYLGGMLSGYALTGDSLYKEKAVHIADKLLPAFNTPTGIPHALINMRTGSSKNFGWASGGCSILSEFGTLQMEFSYLSDITGDPKYRRVVDKIRQVIKSSPRPKKLYPNYLNPKTGKWGQQHTSIGALGDSFYEYLLKEWIRTGKEDVEAKNLMDEAFRDIEKELVKVSASGLTYFAEYKYGRIEHKMDHLACFAGGMYALAAQEEKDDDKTDRWMKLAAGITNTCHESYSRSDTKLGPEAFRFTDAVEARALKQNERYYILRPETFESYFIMWRLTHDQKYRDWGWEAVQALERNCKVEGGYTGIKNVYSVNGQKDDVQQSFFLAETLKYLYLLFSSDDLISLDEWVFNTEAHPFPIKGSPLYRASETIIKPAEDEQQLPEELEKNNEVAIIT